VDIRRHWEHVYATRGERDMSWFEALPTVSLRMLEAAGLSRDTCVVDVGGGDSHLVDVLVARGLDCLAVLDVSSAALQRARSRLGELSNTPIWIEANVADDWSLKPMDIWHDRAVVHFLTDPADRARYRDHLLHTLKAHGSAIVATFAPDGPESCSGLPVMRYSPAMLAAELGPEFRLLDAEPYLHHTPWGGTQSFQYSRLVRVH
jgi:hypothetical protein